MKNNELFDWSLYAALVRHARTQQGIKSVPYFSDVIYWRTRFRISKDVLYRIELNRQEPTAMQFVSINMTLWQKPYPDKYDCNLDTCLGVDWQYIYEGNGIPDDWKRENFASFVGSITSDDWDKTQPVYASDFPRLDDVEPSTNSDLIPYSSFVEQEDAGKRKQGEYVIAIVDGVRVIAG